MSKNVTDWIGDQLGEGEPAAKFAPHVHVWSEMAVRAAIVRALENYEKGKSCAKHSTT
jgi:hypothetical protein